MRLVVRAIAVLLIVTALWAAWSIYWNRQRRAKRAPPRICVCIDPGHPSESNSGTTLQNGTNETRVNWQVAQQLKGVLAEDSRIRVIVTRKSESQFMRNRRRALIANAAHAAIAVHLHCDAGPSHGFTVYFPDRSGKCEGKRGPSKRVIRSSRRAATILHSAMATDLRGMLRDRGIRGDSKTRIGSRIGGITTSIWSTVPVVTVEMVFLSNPSDARFIKSEEGRSAMAAALADGIRRFIRPQLRKLRSG